MRINKRLARGILYEEAAKAAAGYIDARWGQLIEAFSETCEKSSKTHIAFLGTALLAKSVSLEADAFAVKAGTGAPGAYSARGLCHDVLVPNAPELDINLGVTGREPLNNQPYFRIERVSRDIPVRDSATIHALCDLLEELQALETQEQACRALRAFIAVRRKYGLRYSSKVEVQSYLSMDELMRAISSFVTEESQGGRRAQAVVAGIMDLFAGRKRVAIRRVNDPDRSVPGDVSVRVADATEGWERVLEVRDKPVSREDLYLFATKAGRAGVGEAAILAVAAAQPKIPIEEATAWAAERGIGLFVFIGWEAFVQQALFWSATPHLEAARIIPALIHERLMELEVSESGIASWLEKVSKGEAPATEVPQESP